MSLTAAKVSDALSRANTILEANAGLSQEMRGIVELLIMIVQVLAATLFKTSENSSKPPSQDPFRPRRTKRKASAESRKPGGQLGRKATFLKLDPVPHCIEEIQIDRRTLPRGVYAPEGIEKRQLLDIEIKKIVTEYQAEVLRNESTGQVFCAPFPVGIDHLVQYGPKIKAHCVYLSQYQLMPYERLSRYFEDQCGISLSEGSVFNFNKQAYHRLEDVDEKIRSKLSEEAVIHADETGVNIKGSLAWLHTASSRRFVSFFAHKNRGTVAMQAMGVLPNARGVVCHDHWKAYFKYDVVHALCNAHHLRELKAVQGLEGHHWAGQMHTLLTAMNKAVHAAPEGCVRAGEAKKWVRKYRQILRAASEECPAPSPKRGRVGPGRPARSKARNLLERLQAYEGETLRFLTHPLVPFTNNQGENDIRMTKVQQKISGCFRTLKNAQIFCRIRGFLMTCQRSAISPAEALTSVFSDQIPAALVAHL